METVYGIYKKNIYFNSEKGQSAFLLKPAEGTVPKYLTVVIGFCAVLCVLIVGVDTATQYAVSFVTGLITK